MRKKRTGGVRNFFVLCSKGCLEAKEWLNVNQLPKMLKSDLGVFTEFQDSPEVNSDAPDSLKVIRDAPYSVKVIRDAPDSLEMIGVSPDSLEMIGYAPDSLEVFGIALEK